MFLKHGAAVAVILWLTPFAVAHAEWGESVSAQDGFTASWPATPRQSNNVDEGVALRFYTAARGKAACFVVVADYPTAVDPNEETRASRDNFVENIRGTVISSRNTTLARGTTPLPAIEFDARGDKSTYRSMIVVEGARVYMVGGGVPIEGGANADLDQCVRGFKLTPGYRVPVAAQAR